MRKRVKLASQVTGRPAVDILVPALWPSDSFMSFILAELLVPLNTRVLCLLWSQNSSLGRGIRFEKVQCS